MLAKTAILVSILTTLSPSILTAQCLMASTGASCVTPPKSSIPSVSQTPGPVEIGSYLERGDHSIMMNTDYYGLPPVSDGWVYIRIEDDIYRVDFNSFEVLEKVTDQANYYFH